MRLGIVLFNLGGPASLEAVRPFLLSLFSDPAILPVPGWIRFLLARLIVWRRLAEATGIYRQIGGKSPILEQTLAQAAALEACIGQKSPGIQARVVVAMRHAPPRAALALEQLREFGASHIVLLPLYPQFSTTTTGSSLREWQELSRGSGIRTRYLCCWPVLGGWIGALAENMHRTLGQVPPGKPFRVLFSAHSLPESIVAGGDPYALQVAHTIGELRRRLPADIRAVTCYQSRVTPVPWLKPDTATEIATAARAGDGVVVVPVSFVSEHSETLFELDIDGAALARREGAPFFLRVPTVGTAPPFIDALADEALALARDGSSPALRAAPCAGRSGKCSHPDRAEGRPEEAGRGSALVAGIVRPAVPARRQAGCRDCRQPAHS